MPGVAQQADRDTRTLMERIHRGERAAMDELIRTYWSQLLTYARDVVDSPDEAEDVVQEVLLRVWERRTEWAPTDRLLGFLYRVTRNEALNHRRSGRARSRIVDRARAWTRRGPSPADSLERSALAREVETAIDALPPRRREIFILARFHGRTYREIAEILDISPQTVANQMASALSHLRTVLRGVYDEHLPAR